MYDKNGKPMHDVGSATYDTHKDPNEFRKWLEKGLKTYKK